MWKEYENKCYRYLEEHLTEKFHVELIGANDSTKSDILLSNKKEADSFFVEVKKIPSQTSQFVVLPDVENTRFIFSPNNKKEESSLHAAIISHMNKDFEGFNAAGTKGKEIFLEDSSVFSELIKRDYKNKNIRFIICNKMNILSIDDLEKYFDIRCIYRKKRSGSNSPSKLHHPAICEYLKNELLVSEMTFIKNKIYLPLNSDLKGKRFSVGENQYILSDKKELLEVRVLSKTNNSNVIFQLKNKENQESFLTVDSL